MAGETDGQKRVECWKKRANRICLSRSSDVPGGCDPLPQIDLFTLHISGLDSRLRGNDDKGLLLWILFFSLCPLWLSSITFPCALTAWREMNFSIFCRTQGVSQNMRMALFGG